MIIQRPQSILYPLSQSAQIYTDSQYPTGSLTLPADGSSVVNWYDMSQYLALNQATGAKQPVFKTNIRNGLPVIRFDGIQQSFQIFGLNTKFTGSCTFFYALNPTTTSGGRWLMDTQGTSRLIFLINGYDATGIGGSFTAVTGWQILSFRMDGGAGTGRVYRNGSLMLTNSYTTRSFSATTGLFADVGGTTGRFQGDCGSIVAFNTTLTDAQHSDMLRYLGNIWGISTV